MPVGVPALVAQQDGTLTSSGTNVGANGSPQHLTHDQFTKLRGELDIVQGNMAVLNEMLNELVPGKEHPSDIQLLKVIFI